MMEELIKSAKSPIAQILILPLKNIINPVVKFLGKLLDTYIRPMIDGLSGYLKAIVKERKTLESYANQMEVKDTQQVVKNQVQKVKTKEVEVSKQDLAKIKAIKKEVKKNESLDHICGFEDFSLV
jgi:molecular chaperone DnaK (HSP70)